jgi:8-oxo-dGTP pyrophosphatase MutT (NUDIX family)
MFRVLHLGDWPVGKVQTHWTQSTRRLLPQVESAIESAWQHAIQKPNALLFDGPMCRLESWHATPDQLTLTVSPATYKSFFGTNMSHPQFADQFGPDVMANPAGLSTALHSNDGWLLLGRRSETVAYYPGKIHPFAGCMEPTDPDVFTAIHRELLEELSLTEVTNLRCTGIVADEKLRQPELIFAADTPLTRPQITSQLDPAEHRAIYAIPATADGIESALLADAHEMTPVAIASLLLWGRLRLAPDWFNRTATRRLCKMERTK